MRWLGAAAPETMPASFSVRLRREEQGDQVSQGIARGSACFLPKAPRLRGQMQASDCIWENMWRGDAGRVVLEPGGLRGLLQGHTLPMNAKAHLAVGLRVDHRAMPAALVWRPDCEHSPNNVSGSKAR